MALKRLQKEYMGLMKRADFPFGTMEPTDRPLVWKMFLNGPEDTPYNGYKFELELQFPDVYPSKPPAVKFITPIYHVNVNSNYHICLDLFNDWRPTDTLTTVFMALNNLLCEPNFSSAYNSIACKLTREQYDREVARWAQSHAIKR